MPDTLREQQLAFARHVRDPDANPAPEGVEDRRLAVYRELFHNNMAALLGNSFPVLRETLGEGSWRALVRAFYAGHRARTPLFTAIAGEFVAWLAAREAAPADPPWLAELAHHEWVELDLQLRDPTGHAHADGDEHRLSPLARVLAYAWPVHRIGPAYRPAEPPAAPTLLLACCGADGEVRFAELSPLAFRLLQRLAEPAHGPTQALVAGLADEAGRAGDDAFAVEARAMLQRLVDDGVVLGGFASLAR